MARISILNAESKGYCTEARLILNDFAEVDYLDLGSEGLKSQLKNKAYQCLIVRLANYIGKDILDLTSDLKVVATATTGLDHIDMEECDKRHIDVISLRGEASFLRSIHATAEHTWALVLSLIRNLPHAHSNVLKGQWDRDSFIGSELHDKTLGIIGLGRIGSIIAEYAMAFGMDVLVFTRPAEDANGATKLVSLEQLLELSDVISVHLPLNKDTAGFISKQQFLRMQKKPYLVNTARGEIIDDSDLLWALKEGHIKGAALDVLSNESANGITIDNPLVKYATKNPNLIITPHIGGATKESMAKTEIFIAENIRRAFANV